MKLARHAWLLLFSSVVLASPIVAAEITSTVSTGMLATGSSGTVSLPQFDGSLGVLRSVRLDVRANITGSWAVENVAAAPNTMFGQVTGSVQVAAPGIVLPSAPTASFGYGILGGFPVPPTLPAFDGALDFAGASGTTVPFGIWQGSIQSAFGLTPTAMSSYLGAGTVAVAVSVNSALGVANVPAGWQTSASATLDTSVTVRYQYDPFPTYVCKPGGVWLCPCTACCTPSVNGCPNSAFAVGAALTVVGASSLTNDTLALTANQMPDGTTLYFQGNSYSFVPLVDGDGLRCVTGNVVRLGLKQNVSGASQYPGPGDVPIATRGGVLVPGTRAYQVWYRDSVSFCSPATYNFTNGFAVAWVP